MLQLDGSTGSGSPLPFKLDSSSPSFIIYLEYYRCISALSNRAFSLAKDLDNFPAWSQAASSYVDLYLRLATMCGGWVLETEEDAVDVKEAVRKVDKALGEFQAKLIGEVSQATFLKAYACHHPSSSPPITSPIPSTSPTSLSSPQRAPHTTSQLANSLPAHQAPSAPPAVAALALANLHGSRRSWMRSKALNSSFPTHVDASQRVDPSSSNSGITAQ